MIGCVINDDCQAGAGTEAGKPAGVRMREMIFLNFASIEFGGNVYMTPNDFLQSIVDDKPRCKSVNNTENINIVFLTFLD